jgi:hypothetical protein
MGREALIARANPVRPTVGPESAYTRTMYLVLTGLATLIVAFGAASARAPRAIPIRVRSQRVVRVIRRD